MDEKVVCVSRWGGLYIYVDGSYLNSIYMLQTAGLNSKSERLENFLNIFLEMLTKDSLLPSVATSNLGHTTKKEELLPWLMVFD